MMSLLRSLLKLTSAAETSVRFSCSRLLVPLRLRGFRLTSALKPHLVPISERARCRWAFGGAHFPEQILTIFSQGIQIDMIKTKEIFRILFLFVHGYASMLANNTISFDGKSIANDLELVLDGAICMKQEGAK